MMRELDAALDALIERFGQGAYAGEIARARIQHTERTGRVFEEDEIYEARTLAFLEWYVLERPLDESGVTPAALAIAAGDAADELRGAWHAWATSHRSLFLVEAVQESGVRLLDLCGGAHFAVDERRRLHGVAAGDIVEARLVGWRQRVRFGRAFKFHPSDARKAIVAHVRRILGAGGSRTDAVDHVATLQVRTLRWTHGEAAKVYEDVGR
jgi:hypothetical protein